jgi:phenylacetate-CoA ligase
MARLPKLFRNRTIKQWESGLRTKPESYWIKRGEHASLKLFHQMARRVPAYKDFLKKAKINPSKVKTIRDFQQLPSIDKDNYLRKYSREQLSWDGKYPRGQWTIASTSGSTGEPFYFPRQNFQDEEYALTAELYLRTNFQIHKKKTLYIVAFPMGVWIGGLFTYEALQLLAARGNYDLSIITPGINKLEIIKSIKNLASHYDQVIIGSYGPFLKDILDDGERMGIRWKDYNLGFVFSAEGFSEGFRDYVIKMTGLKNAFTGTLNHYGTVDLGTMSYETPYAVMLRRIAVKNPKIYELLFNQTQKLPTLTQYLPEQFYFEEVNNRLYCSASSGMPLVRYDLKDHGGVFTSSYIKKELRTLGVDVSKEARKAHIESTIWNLPFVHVYERSDFSVSFFAFQIYPETIRKALHREEFHKLITGKFSMMVKYNKQNNQVLEINIELKHGIAPSPSLRKKVQLAIVKHLLDENSEYRKTYEEYGMRKTEPKLVFWRYEDPKHFMPGIKQKWVKKA